MFGAIAGVPPDLVDADTRSRRPQSDAARDALYDNVLNDQRMQEVVDPADGHRARRRNLLPSCNTRAARRFRRAVWSRSRSSLRRRTASSSRCVRPTWPGRCSCSPSTSARGSARAASRAHQPADDGKAACDVIWELPQLRSAAERAGELFADSPSPPRPAPATSAAASCARSIRLALKDGKPTGDGWFVEDESARLPANMLQKGIDRNGIACSSTATKPGEARSRRVT